MEHSSTHGELGPRVMLDFNTDMPGGHSLVPFEESLSLQFLNRFGDFGDFVKEGKHHIPAVPAEPVRTTAMSDLAFASTQKIWSKKNEKAATDVAEWEGNGQTKAYAEMKSLCSKPVWDLVKLLQSGDTTTAAIDFAGLERQRDPLVLRDVLRFIMRRGPGGRELPGHQALLESVFNSLSSGSMPLEDFNTKYDAALELAAQAGITVPTVESKIALNYFFKLDKPRFGDLHDSLEASAQNGQSLYPTTLAGAKLRAKQHLDAKAKKSVSPVFVTTGSASDEYLY